ncbi:MAG: hypothetical protein Q7T05_01270 [Dehalococcoidia bacterium]|nr:hypothetical protein [Dehalococcoidia bacterium]
MPQTVNRRKKCAVCGELNLQPSVREAKRHGSPDLDTRPPADVRFCIDTLVQRCPSCGYCFYNIGKLAPGAAETVKSDAYQKQLKNPDFHTLANNFLCWSLIELQAGNFSGAGWACIHAAWICDDAADFNRLYGNISKSQVGTRDEADAAKLCRLKAIGLLKLARDEGQVFGAHPGSEEALMSDLLRRMGRFESAKKMVQCGHQVKAAGVVETVLQYEKELAQKGDVDVHTMAEAIKWKGEQTGPAEQRDSAPPQGNEPPDSSS